MVHMSGHRAAWLHDFANRKGGSQVCCLCISAGATVGTSSKTCIDEIPTVAPVVHGRVTRKCAGLPRSVAWIEPIEMSERKPAYFRNNFNIEFFRWFGSVH